MSGCSKINKADLRLNEIKVMGVLECVHDFKPKSKAKAKALLLLYDL